MNLWDVLSGANSRSGSAMANYSLARGQTKNGSRRPHGGWWREDEVFSRLQIYQQTPDWQLLCRSEMAKNKHVEMNRRWGWVRSGGIELISLHESRWVGSWWTDIFPRPAINSDEHFFPSGFSEDKKNEANMFKIPPSLLTGNMQMFSFTTVLHLLDFLGTVRKYVMGMVWNYVKLYVLF